MKIAKRIYLPVKCREDGLYDYVLDSRDKPRSYTSEEMAKKYCKDFDFLVSYTVENIIPEFLL